jgi:ubiquinone/menaquinone biosynthesis C-methylase UbiE
LFKNYLTADLNFPDVMVKMDITDIQYPDNTFDIIFCLDVLEHVIDAEKAISELYRVLKKDGWGLIISTPISENQETYEDWSITTPEGRHKAFGQFDHVRVFGQDFWNKLRDGGFANISLIKADEFLSKRQLDRMSILPRQKIFHLVK